MTISWWKLSREVERIGQQIKSVLWLWAEQRIQRRHDANFESGVTIINGMQPRTEKILLLLLYQPEDLSDSVLHTCRFVVKHGYSPLIVANGGLQQTSRTELMPCVWKMIERPNIGYDFGGYRDGIRFLWKLDISPEELLIMNDSIWFPLQEASNFINDLEAVPGDICGTVLRTRSDGVEFLESYCYLIKHHVFDSDAFRRFWQNFRLSSNKYSVIRRGERGFSMAMCDAGFQLTALFSKQQFLDELSGQTDAFLETTLRYGAHHDPAVEKKRLEVIADFGKEGWRDDAMAFVSLALCKGQFYSVFPFAMVRMMEYPVLKKSKDVTAAAWRQAYRQALYDQLLPLPHPTIYDELCDSALPFTVN